MGSEDVALRRAKRLWVFFREIVVSARCQAVTSTVSILIACGAGCLVVVTAGQAAASQEQVLASVDAQGTRTMSLYAIDEDAPFSPDLVEAIGSISLVETAVGLSPSFDVTAAVNPHGNRVGARFITGPYARGLSEWAGRTNNPGLQPKALVTPTARETLGFPPQGGSVRTVGDGSEFIVAGTADLPEFLRVLEPVVLIPSDDPALEIGTIMISADRPENLPVIEDLVSDFLSGRTGEQYSIETSEQLASLRSAIAGNLTAATHGLVVATLAGCAAATMLVVWTVVLLRRQDFGRRRALGATRTMIVTLTIGQVALTVGAGTLLGVALGSGIVVARSSHMPPIEFLCALTIALIATSCLTSLIPAIWAAVRDPLHELRVP